MTYQQRLNALPLLLHELFRAPLRVGSHLMLSLFLNTLKDLSKSSPLLLANMSVHTLRSVARFSSELLLQVVQLRHPGFIVTVCVSTVSNVLIDRLDWLMH